MSEILRADLTASYLHLRRLMDIVGHQDQYFVIIKVTPPAAFTRMTQDIERLHTSFNAWQGVCLDLELPNRLPGENKNWLNGDKEVVYPDGRTVALSCNVSCGPGDFRAGGKCEQNGCFPMPDRSENEGPVF